MKTKISITSQGRLLDASLFSQKVYKELQPGIYIEGSMTGATQGYVEKIATLLAEEGLICLIVDHSYYTENESLAQSWESPHKRVEDIKSALNFLAHQKEIDPGKIIGVGVSVGAEYLAKACVTNGVCQGFIMVEGKDDDSQNWIESLSIPSVIMSDEEPEQLAERILVWARSLFKKEKAAPKFSFMDWSRFGG